MKVRYSREHVRECIALAMILGTLMGYWFGTRAGDAGLFETAGVLLVFYVASIVGGSRIDKRHAEREG